MDYEKRNNRRIIYLEKLENRKPLIIRGARQVAKTWLMQEFGRRHYAQALIVHSLAYVSLLVYE